jgi:hypothetical protein
MKFTSETDSKQIAWNNMQLDILCKHTYIMKHKLHTARLVQFVLPCNRACGIVALFPVKSGEVFERHKFSTELVCYTVRIHLFVFNYSQMYIIML